jgi:hypothetical protein
LPLLSIGAPPRSDLSLVLPRCFFLEYPKALSPLTQVQSLEKIRVQAQPVSNDWKISYNPENQLEFE